ncbi:MAG: hypothetical protein AAGF23_01740 [Acidobacteriota bacterium]
MFIRNAFFLLALLLLSAPAFAFGSAGADCDGDGVNDISCSGDVCGSAAAGARPGVGGYCKCASIGAPSDHKTCAELPTIAPATFMFHDIPWLTPSPNATDVPGEELEGSDGELKDEGSAAPSAAPVAVKTV